MVIREKIELEEYLKHNEISSQEYKYERYKLMLNVWNQDDSISEVLSKQAIKGSVYGSLMRAILAIYRKVKKFIWVTKYLSVKKKINMGIDILADRMHLRNKHNKEYIQSIMPDEQSIKSQQRYSENWDKRISILVPLYNTPKDYLCDMIDSVIGQSYDKWQLCLANGSDDEHKYVEEICERYVNEDARICYERLAENRGIAGNTNFCIGMAKGEYIAFFDHDDILHPSALYECMKKVIDEEAELVYTDELTFRGNSLYNIVKKHYKPDFSPENLRGVNYICHFTMFKKSLLDKTGLLDDRYNGSQDHDIILKLTTQANRVSHVPKILYFWRVHKDSVSMDIGAKEYAIEAGKNAVRDNEERLGREVKVFSSLVGATYYRLDYKIIDNPKITIVILGDNIDKINKTLNSICSKTTYDNYEVVCGDDLVELIGEANGEYLFFMTQGMECVIENWIQMLLMYVQQEEIAIVAGRILDKKGVIRESGYIIELNEENTMVAIEQGNMYNELGYMSRFYYAHNVSACSLVGSMMKREMAQVLYREDIKCVESNRDKGIALSKYAREDERRIVINPYVMFMMRDMVSKSLGINDETIV